MTRALALAALLLVALPSPAATDGDAPASAAALFTGAERAVIERMLRREMPR